VASAAASKEEAGCSTGPATGGSSTGWNVRREAAIEAAKAERGDSTAGVPQSRLSTTHTVVAVTETRTGDGHTIEAMAAVERTVRTTAANALDQSNAALMGDAPACDGCGSITVRNGTCYRCLNCGNSMGCS